MIARRIIACLDLADGRVVKGVRFDRLRDAGDPVERAAIYQDDGADEIVALDIRATPRGRRHAITTIRRLREVLRIPLVAGGGIGNAADAAVLLEAGADKVAINTAAVERPALIQSLADRFGCQCIVVAVDARRRRDDWEVLVRSGTRPTGRAAAAWARQACELGAGEILLTSWDRDGTLRGYDLALLDAVREAVSVPVVASGGAAGASDFAQAFAHGADAVLAASIFHDGRASVAAIKRRLLAAGIRVRP